MISGKEFITQVGVIKSFERNEAGSLYANHPELIGHSHYK